MVRAFAEDFPRPLSGVFGAGSLGLGEQVAAEVLAHVLPNEGEPPLQHRIAAAAADVLDGRVDPDHDGALLPGEPLPEFVVCGASEAGGARVRLPCVRAGGGFRCACPCSCACSRRRATRCPALPTSSASAATTPGQGRDARARRTPPTPRTASCRCPRRRTDRAPCIPPASRRLAARSQAGQPRGPLIRRYCSTPTPAPRSGRTACPR